MKDAAAAGWEKVRTVHDYCDGPRSGIADYRGVPHAYKCKWDSAVDEWSTEFLLSPITPEQLAVIEEAWSIWRRYQEKFQQGTLEPGDKHPALAADWSRHMQLKPLVENALQLDEARAEHAVPEFRATIEPEHNFEVRWRPCSK